MKVLQTDPTEYTEPVAQSSSEQIYTEEFAQEAVTENLPSTLEDSEDVTDEPSAV